MASNIENSKKRKADEAEKAEAEVVVKECEVSKAEQDASEKPADKRAKVTQTEDADGVDNEKAKEDADEEKAEEEEDEFASKWWLPKRCDQAYHATHKCTNPKCKETVCSHCGVDCAGMRQESDACESRFCYECSVDKTVAKQFTCTAAPCCVLAKPVADNADDMSRMREQKFTGFCDTCAATCAGCNMRVCKWSQPANWQTSCYCTPSHSWWQSCVCEAVGHAACFKACNACTRSVSDMCAITHASGALVCKREQCAAKATKVY